MIIAMLLAHLTGDYVLQWDALARWKGASIKGAAFHGSIVLAVSVLFAVPIDPGWLPWALLIGLAHIAIDASWVVFNRRFAPGSGMYGLVRLLIDQTLHLAVILFALFASGYATPATFLGTAAAEVQTHRAWAIALGYVLISMPAWIFIEFIFYGPIDGSAPDFSRVGEYKYVGSLERGLIATFVATGQFTLVPIVALPRLVLETPLYFGDNRTTLYIAEWLSSLALAVLIGLLGLSIAAGALTPVAFGWSTSIPALETVAAQGSGCLKEPDGALLAVEGVGVARRVDGVEVGRPY